MKTVVEAYKIAIARFRGVPKNPDPDAWWDKVAETTLELMGGPGWLPNLVIGRELPGKRDFCNAVLRLNARPRKETPGLVDWDAEWPDDEDEDDEGE